MDKDQPVSPEVKNSGKSSEATDARSGKKRADDDLRARQEQLLDEGVEETFPASDPVSVVRVPGA